MMSNSDSFDNLVVPQLTTVYWPEDSLSLGSNGSECALSMDYADVQPDDIKTWLDVAPAAAADDLSSNAESACLDHEIQMSSATDAAIGAFKATPQLLSRPAPVATAEQPDTSDNADVVAAADATPRGRKRTRTRAVAQAGEAQSIGITTGVTSTQDEEDDDHEEEEEETAATDDSFVVQDKDDDDSDFKPSSGPGRARKRRKTAAAAAAASSSATASTTTPKRRRSRGVTPQKGRVQGQKYQQEVLVYNGADGEIEIRGTLVGRTTPVEVIEKLLEDTTDIPAKDVALLRRIAKNRRSAAKHRSKVRQYTANLEAEVKELRDANERLNREVVHLRAEREAMSAEIDHLRARLG